MIMSKSKEVRILGIIIAISAILWIVGSINEKHEQKVKKQIEYQKHIAQIKKQAQLNFIKNIEIHYAKLVKLANEKQIDEALARIALFRKYGKQKYKDVEKYNKIIRKQSLTQKVEKLPASDIQENLKIYRELFALEPNNSTYQKKVNYYQRKWKKYLKQKQENEYRASCQLEVITPHWYKEYGYAIYEGQVKNISHSKLDNVQAVATWYDKNGSMITSSNALIEYNPILPGQISPFKVMKTYNPAMEKAGIEFSKLMGGTLKAYRKK